MSIDPRAFPGVPQVQFGADGGGGNTLTVSLPAPPAGSRQYLAAIIVTYDTGAAATGASVNPSNLDVGGGSAPHWSVFSSTTGEGYYPFNFSPWWPANATGVAIGVTLNSYAATFVSSVRVNLFGYNVAE